MIKKYFQKEGESEGTGHGPKVKRRRGVRKESSECWMDLVLWGKLGQSVYTSAYVKKEESGIVKML